MPTLKWRKEHKEELRKYRRDWYDRNKQHARAKIHERKKELKTWMETMKKALSCSNCGEPHPACLEFHHLDRGAKEINNHQLTQVVCCVTLRISR